MTRVILVMASICVAAFLSIAAQAAVAQTDDDLATVLNRVAGAADVEILFAPDVVAEKRPGSVEIEGAPEVVLGRVLAGTGLTAEQTSPNVYVVRSAQDGSNSQSSQAAESSQGVGQRQQANGVGSIEGRVFDGPTGTGLAGATVRVRGSEISSVTDQRGFFRLSAVPGGRLDLEVEYIGAETQSKAVMLFPNQNVVTDFELNLGAGDTIYVYGTRSSFLQALNQQRNAENNRTVVSADLLGTFPAETVSEALRRLPGVTFVRDVNTGEGNRVSVRGITSEGINIQVNGMQLQGTGVDRAVDLTGFLADNISQITIQKSLLPEFEGTGNGGLIEIETKSALDYGERYLSFGIEREFSSIDEFGDETQYSGAGVLQLSDSFAVGINAQYRTTDRQNVTVRSTNLTLPVRPEGFNSLSFVPFTFGPYPFDPEVNTPLTTGAFYTVRNREADNLNGSLFAAWDLGESTRLRVEYQRIESDEFDTTQNSSNLTSPGVLSMAIPELGGEERRRSYIRALSLSQSVADFETTRATDVLSLRGESFAGRWTFNYDAGFTRSENEVLSYTVSTRSDLNTDVLNLLDASSYTTNPDNNGVDRIVDGAFRIVGDRIPELALSAAGRSVALSPDPYYIGTAVENQRLNETENVLLRLKAQRDFVGERLRNVKFGLQYNDIDRQNSDDGTNNIVPTSRSYVRDIRQGVRQFISGFSGDPFFTRNLGIIGAGDTAAAFLRAGTAESLFNQVAAFSDANPGVYIVRDNLGSPQEDSGAITPGVIVEEILAAFVQAEVSLGDVTVTGGFRFEQVDYVGSALNSPIVFQTDDVFSGVDRSILASAGLVEVFDNSGTTEKVLPSLVATWRPNERWVGRFAYNRTIFNPALVAINRPPTVVIDQRERFNRNRASIREGNPDLEQTVNDNYELGIEYYFPNRPAYVKAAVFYKDIKDNITNVSLIELPANIEARIRDFLAPLAADFPDVLANLNEETEYVLQRPENGEGGEIHGIELEGATNLDFFPESWPRFLENIQLLANVTWTDAEFPTIIPARTEDGELFDLVVDRPLEEQSEWAGNFSIGYDAGGFSGRLLYTYQAERVDTYDEFNVNTVIPDIETLDFISTYNFEWSGTQYTLFVEADNLLDSRRDAIAQRGFGSFGGEGSPDFFYPTSLLFDGGRTFTIGVRGVF